MVTQRSENPLLGLARAGRRTMWGQSVGYDGDVSGGKRNRRKVRAWATGVGMLVVIACAGCASGVTRDPATHTEMADRGATGEYLRAREALMRSSMADLPAGSRPMAAFVAHVRAECPGALRGTPIDQLAPLPKGGSVEQERAEFEDARFAVKIDQRLEVAQQQRLEAAVRRFATTVASIRWDNPRIAELVNTFVEIELQRRHMPQLDVCRAIREWVASDYRKVPAPASAEPRGAIGRRWERAVAALGCGKFSPADPREVLRALRPYQQPSGHPTTRDVEVMEIQLSLEEARARKGATRSLRQALGMSTIRSKRSRRRRPLTALNAPPEPPACRGTPDLISEPAKGPVGENIIYVNPGVAACVRSQGLTVLNDGELVSKTLTAAELEAAAKRCGFEVKKGAQAAGKAAAKPPVRKPPDWARQPSAMKAESFRSRAVAEVMACLRKAGVDVPNSDSALLSSTSGIETRSPRIRASIGKCRSESLATASG
jgi:hypothetical protein